MRQSTTPKAHTLTRIHETKKKKKHIHQTKKKKKQNAAAKRIVLEVTWHR